MTTPDQRLWRRVAHLEQLVERLEGMVLRQGGVRSTLPLSGRLWRFSLNEAWTDNEAEADLIALDGTDTEKDVTLYDPEGAASSLGSGGTGYCVEQIDVLGQRRYCPLGAGGGDGRVAYTESIIYGRDGTTPGGDGAGGPRSVQPVKLDGSSPPVIVTDGGTVNIYSWVTADSTDPADEAGGKLYIFIEQDPHGTWWFTGQDCPPGADL